MIQSKEDRVWLDLKELERTEIAMKYVRFYRYDFSAWSTMLFFLERTNLLNVSTYFRFIYQSSRILLYLPLLRNFLIGFL